MGRRTPTAGRRHPTYGKKDPYLRIKASLPTEGAALPTGRRHPTYG